MTILGLFFWVSSLFITESNFAYISDKIKLLNTKVVKWIPQHYCCISDPKAKLLQLNITQCWWDPHTAFAQKILRSYSWELFQLKQIVAQKTFCIKNILHKKCFAQKNFLLEQMFIFNKLSHAAICRRECDA